MQVIAKRYNERTGRWDMADIVPGGTARLIADGYAVTVDTREAKVIEAFVTALANQKAVQDKHYVVLDDEFTRRTGERVLGKKFVRPSGLLVETADDLGSLL